MESVFSSVGCNLTKKDFEKTVGLRIDEVVNYWFLVNPWPTVSNEEVAHRIIHKMVDLLSADGKPLRGVVESLNFFKNRGLKIGLATSSYEILIDCVLKTLAIEDFFQVTRSAELETHGKPHPAVYLSTAKLLGVEPQNCLVIEDSLNGVISGKAAKMKVICIPEKTHFPNEKLILADYLFEDMLEMLSNIQ
jgi:HAD superfamily hydrolase (TIGR01509 family)